jgi:hypothetical protein
MKENMALTIASLLSILFLTFHLADDIVRGMAPGTVSTIFGLLVLAVWLYGTLALAERRSGYVIIFLGSLIGSGISVLHMMGKGLGVSGSIPKSNGAFFFIWTILALGVTGLLSIILSAHGFWSLQWGPARRAKSERWKGQASAA